MVVFGAIGAILGYVFFNWLRTFVLFAVLFAVLVAVLYFFCGAGWLVWTALRMQSVDHV